MKTIRNSLSDNQLNDLNDMATDIIDLLKTSKFGQTINNSVQ